MKLNIQHVSDTNKLVKAGILALENELGHRTAGEVRTLLHKAQSDLIDARMSLEKILDMDVEGRQWT